VEYLISLRTYLHPAVPALYLPPRLTPSQSFPTTDWYHVLYPLYLLSLLCVLCHVWISVSDIKHVPPIYGFWISTALTSGLQIRTRKRNYEYTKLRKKSTFRNFRSSIEHAYERTNRSWHTVVDNRISLCICLDSGNISSAANPTDLIPNTGYRIPGPRRWT
jgi:hypothetical protein